MSLHLQLYVCSAASVVLAVFCLYNSLSIPTLSWRFGYVVFSNISWLYLTPGLLLAGVATILYRTHANHPARSFPTWVAVLMYCVFLYLRIKSAYVLWKVTRSAKDVERAQKKVLDEILTHAKATSYATETGLDKVESRDEFLAHQPITTYDHYRSYVQRVVEGEKNVMFPDEVDFIGATTGTTSGTSKLFPKNRKLFISRTYLDGVSYLDSLLKIPGATNVKPVADFKFKTKLRRTHGGVPIGALTAMFGNMFGRTSAIPPIAKEIPDMMAAFYVQLMFCMRERELSMIAPGFGSHAYTMFKLMDDRWRDLCHDIRTGDICQGVKDNIPLYIQDELRAYQRPDPDRADELIKVFSEGIQDIAPRVWPHASMIGAIVTGPFAIYKSIMQAKYTGRIPMVSWGHGGTESEYGNNVWCGQSGDEVFLIAFDRVFYEFLDIRESETLKLRCAHEAKYAGGLPIVTTIHGSTEGMYAGNLGCGDEHETFMPFINAIFFEFLEVDESGDSCPQALLAHQVEIGKRYEMVVTTIDGLYRYRTNDVIEVTSFLNQAPVYEFVQRADDNLSVYAEKTPVCEIIYALESVSRDWHGCDIADFTTTESIHVFNVTGESDEMCYVILMEVSGVRPTQSQIAQLDAAVCERVEAYSIYRDKGRIGPIRIEHTAPGAFARLRDFILTRNVDASSIQFKIPRLVRREDYVRCLLEGVDNSA